MSHRIERVNSLIRQEISDLLRRQVKDPRLGNFITITGVDTTPDLKYARVYVCHIDGAVHKEETISTLNSAAGFLHKQLLKRMRMHRIPELSFHWDDTMERADHLMQLINRLSSEDNP